MEFVGIGILIALVVAAVFLQNAISTNRGISSRMPYWVSLVALGIGFVVIIAMTAVSRFAIQ